MKGYYSLRKDQRPRTIRTECMKLNGIIKRETDAAILFNFNHPITDVETETWFPLSQVSQIHRTKSIMNGTLDAIVISVWIAQKKGLVESEELS